VGSGQRVAGGLVAGLVPFVAAAMSGVRVPEGARIGQLGKLPEEYRKAADSRLVDYVVMSYGTPIAWHMASGNAGWWVMPDTRYSVTTSRHQGIVRRAVDVTSDCIATLNMA